MMFQAASKPSSMSQLVSAGLKLYSCTFKKVLLLAFIVNLMILLGGLVWKIPAASTSGAIIIGIIALLIFIGAVVAGITAYNAMLGIVGKTLQGQHEVASNMAISDGFKAFWPVLAAIILAYLAIIAGMFALVIPGIFLSITLFVYLPLVVVDKQGPLEALVQSICLTWGNWWRTLLLMVFGTFCYTVVFVIVAVIIVGIPNIVTHHLPFTANMYLLDIVSLIVGTLFTPWFAALALVVLNDFKVRKSL